MEKWKTINLGTDIKDADGFCRAIIDANMSISSWANDIIGKPEFKVVAEEIEIELVKITVGNLGFENGAQRNQIYERAQELGLKLCPAEVGPQLRLQYKNQEPGEEIFVGMEPIRASDGFPNIFSVICYANGPWLYSHYKSPNAIWCAYSQWVFVHPRKCQ